MSGRTRRPRPSAEIDLRGSLDSVEPDGRAFGWCWSPDEPDTRRAIQILLDGEAAAAAVADVLRDDLLAAGIGDGGHGFAAEIPIAHRRPGQAAAALVDVATGRRVGGEIGVTWPGAADVLPPLAGNIDLITRDGWVSGWCWDPEAPARRLWIEVLIDEERVASAEAAEPRADLTQAGVGDGRYGFNVMLPYEALVDRGAVQVRVVERATGRPLGEPALLRIGRRAESETRLMELERQVSLMRSRLDDLAQAATQQPEAEARATRSLFAMVAGFFQDLADGLEPGHQRGPGAALAELQATLPALALRPPAAGADGKPLATLAVPANASVDQVHACLAALRQADTDLAADIVLLDPAGHDPRCALLPALVANLHVGPAADSAVASFARLLKDADTRLVGLVSPRTRPTRAWLETLAATLAESEHAAIAGAIALRPDGRLQHAGFVLEDSGRFRDLGYLADPERREHRFLRPVDALAPLAILADRVRVGEAGGLDPAYQAFAPALADLCLGLRARGFAVLRQPGSAVIWTGDESTASWSMPAPVAGSEDGRRLRLAVLRHGREARAEAGFVGHALVVDADVPVPERDAGSVACLEQMLVLRRLGWRVTFAAASGAAPADADRRRLEQVGIEVAAAGDDGVTDVLRELGPGLQLVHLYRHRIAGLLLPRVREFAPQARVIFSPADLHFLREAREAALLGGGVADRVAETRAQEIACVRDADATILLSDHERDVLAAEVGGDKLHLLRWIVRPDATVPPFEARAGLLFVGNFRHPPNVDAVLWYAREILPILGHLRPGLVLDLAGADAPPAVRALDGDAIRVLGWVPDLAALLAGTRLTIAPLRYGAGFKGKVASSLAAGVPVVGTPVAFEGTGLSNGDGIAVATTPMGCAQAIARLHDDAALWRRMSDRARERVGDLYSPRSADAIFAQLLAGLGLPFRRA